MATQFGDSLASKLSRENRVFCTNRVKTQTVFQKLFNFPLITCLSLGLLRLSLSQNCHFHSKNLYFHIQSSLKILEKIWVFTYFQSISSLKPYFSWICCVCWDIEIWLINMGFCWLWWNCCMGFVKDDGIMLVLHALNVFITCSCIILWFELCCVVHIM